MLTCNFKYSWIKSQPWVGIVSWRYHFNQEYNICSKLELSPSFTYWIYLRGHEMIFCIIRYFAPLDTQIPASFRGSKMMGYIYCGSIMTISVPCFNKTWWRHQMETFSVLLALCAGNSPANSPHKGQWHGALMFSLIYTWIHNWVNNRKARDLRRHRAHYDVIVMNRW